MINYEQMYREKLRTAEEIVSNIQSGYVCCCPTGTGEPEAIMNALTERVLKENLNNIEHHLMLASRRWKYWAPELAGKIKHVSWFTSGASRPVVQDGRADFMPGFFYENAVRWVKYVQEADVFYAMVSPMDKHGYFSFGPAASEAHAQMSVARKVYIEVNPKVPRVLGDCFIHISQVDLLCESSNPLPNLGETVLNEKDIKIGELIAEHIPDGATIQLGIGGMPNAVGMKLMDKKDLGLHTEMFTDSMVVLMESGAVNNSKKNIHKGKTIATFGVGSQSMYDFIDDNPAVEFYPVSYVNDPRVIAQNDNVISINACVEVDFIGQVCSESIGAKNISGTGGQVDFVRGANWSKGGKAFICTYSTAKDDTISKIVPALATGAHVTTSKNDVDHIVTEYGIAALKGKTAAQRAKALIAVAHPAFRDKLTFEAKKMNLMV